MPEAEEDPNYDIRFPERRRIIRRLTIGVLLFAIVYLVVQIENCQGRNAWKKLKAELEAKGETFDILKLTPPPVPSESNFASAPFFTNLYDFYRDASGKIVWRNTNALNEQLFSIYGSDSRVDSPGLGFWSLGLKLDLTEWQLYYRELQDEYAAKSRKDPHAFFVPEQPGKPADDVLLALSKFNEPLEELRSFSSRPFSRFPVAYENRFHAQLPHLAKLKQLNQFLQLRAGAELETGLTERAADDVVLGLRIANATRSEPLLISHLVRIACATIALTPLWEGLDAQLWTDAQLQRFQEELNQFDFLQAYLFAMRGERAFCEFTVDATRTNRSELLADFFGKPNPSSLQGYVAAKLTSGAIHAIPDGCFYWNQYYIAQMYEDILLALDPASRRVSFPKIKKTESAAAELNQGFSLHKFLAAMLVSAVIKSSMKSAHAQTAIDLARVACALERYRINHGNYPDTLSELEGQFIERLPHDIINGEPLQYRRTEGGRYVLYSVGWNETDDGGIPGRGSTGRVHRQDEGDWVWFSSAKTD